jgi:hypothetical protein
MLETMLAGGKPPTPQPNSTLLLLQADKGGVDQAKPTRAFSKVPTVTTSSVAKFNNKMFTCTSSPNYFEMIASERADLVFAANQDYTIEWWSRNNSIAGSWWLYFAGNNTQSYLRNNGGTITLRDQSAGLTFNGNFWPLSNWTHIALVNKDGVTKLYINGSTAVTGAGFSSGGWGLSTAIARIGFGEATMFGDIDQIRISKVARYNANFSVPTTPFVVD